VGEFGSTILVSGNARRAQRNGADLHFCEVQRRPDRSGKRVAIVLALFSFLILACCFSRAIWLDVD